VLKSRYLNWLAKESGKMGYQIALLAMLGGFLQAAVVMIINGALSNMGGR
jgi:hypothetical protein